MYIKAFILLTVCVATLMFFGCGGDEEDETVVVISNKTPVISVEKIRENPDPENEMYREVWFKFTADPAPRKEMLVSFYRVIYEYRVVTRAGCTFSDGDRWVNISKGEKESKEFSISVEVNGYCAVKINPIPTVDIVGEGEKVDMDELEKEWGTKTFGGQRIPEDFQFPYYEVGENPELILYDAAEDVEIVSIDPPVDSIVETNQIFTITFSSPPFCPIQRASNSAAWRMDRVSPTTFTTGIGSLGGRG